MMGGIVRTVRIVEREQRSKQREKMTDVEMRAIVELLVNMGGKMSLRQPRIRRSSMVVQRRCRGGIHQTKTVSDT